MLVLVSYDVATSEDGGQRRLRRVAKACLDYGQRVQYSVFECIIDPAILKMLQHDLEEIIDSEEDSIRYYYLGKNWKRKVEHVGVKPSLDMEGLLIT